MEVKSVKGYYIRAATSEVAIGRVKGPFLDRNIAIMECEGAGWYGANGKIEEVWFIEFGNGRLAEYDPNEPLVFVDLKRDSEKEMLERIRSKLSTEEMEFIVEKSIDSFKKEIQKSNT